MQSQLMHQMDDITLIRVRESFLKSVNDEVRRWREFDKAAATANTIRVNKKIWNKYPDWNPLSNYVINLKTGAIVKS